MARVLGLPCTLLLLLGGCGDAGGGGSGSAGSATGVTSATSMTSATTSTSDASGGSSGAPGTSGGAVSTGGDDPTTGGATADATSSPFDTGGSTGWWETTGGDGDDMCKLNIDIVFVMDVSTSMAAILQKLADEILVVDAAIQALELPTQPSYGLVVFVDDATMINSGKPYADAKALQADFVQWSNFTQSNSQTSGQGFNSDWPENTLDALYTAAFAFQWRPVESTLRMIIHTTDDTFGDKGASQSGVTVQHSYDETVLALQEREIRVFSFADADATGGQFNDLDVGWGFFKPYDGKTAIPTATDGGAFNINDVYDGTLSLSAAINMSVEESLCMQYIPQ